MSVFYLENRCCHRGVFLRSTEEKEDFEKLSPGETAYYDGMVYVDLDKVEPMIAMPFHPSNAYTIRELNQNLSEILHDVEQKSAGKSWRRCEFHNLQDKVRNGKAFMWKQGIIAGCAGGGFENICAASEILSGLRNRSR